MESHHGQSRDGHLVKRAHSAVAPDVNRARDADGGQGDHEDPQPGVVVSGSGEPEVHKARNSGEGRADPGVQDGSD